MCTHTLMKKKKNKQTTQGRLRLSGSCDSGSLLCVTDKLCFQEEDSRKGCNGLMGGSLAELIFLAGLFFKNKLTIK